MNGLIMGPGMKITKEAQDLQKKKMFFVRLAPALIIKVNKKRIKDGLKWGSLVTIMFKNYLREKWKN